MLIIIYVLRIRCRGDRFLLLYKKLSGNLSNFMICQEFLLYGIGMSVGGGLGHFEVHLKAVKLTHFNNLLKRMWFIMQSPNT